MKRLAEAGGRVRRLPARRSSAVNRIRRGGPYKVLKKARVGGDGGFDYVYAVVSGRRLYVPRGGAGARITVFNLDNQRGGRGQMVPGSFSILVVGN